MSLSITFKALLLIPAAFAGAMTVLLFDDPPRDLAETALVLAILGPGYLVPVAAVAWMWQGTAERRYLGHGRNTWSLLLAFSFIAGLLAMLLI